MKVLAWTDEPFLQRGCKLHPDEIADLIADASAAAALAGFKSGDRVEVCMDEDRFERWLPGLVESTTSKFINVALDSGGVVKAYVESVRHKKRSA